MKAYEQQIKWNRRTLWAAAVLMAVVVLGAGLWAGRAAAHHAQPPQPEPVRPQEIMGHGRMGHGMAGHGMADHRMAHHGMTGHMMMGHGMMGGRMGTGVEQATPPAEITTSAAPDNLPDSVPDSVPGTVPGGVPDSASDNATGSIQGKDQESAQAAQENAQGFGALVQSADLRRGRQLIAAGGCLGCHSLDENRAAVGPTWEGLAQTAAGRVPGQDAAAYLYDSIVRPNANVVPGFRPNIMPQTYGQQFSTQELADIVKYLLAQED